MKHLLFIALALTAFTLPAFAQKDDGKDALAVVNKLFDEMAAANAAGILATGIPENISTSTKVYPNPSNGKFIVQTISGNKSVTLIDYTGRSLMQFDTKEKNFTIDISNKFSSGIYYLIIRCGDEVSYERIIYQR